VIAGCSEPICICLKGKELPDRRADFPKLNAVFCLTICLRFEWSMGAKEFFHLFAFGRGQNE
jgi:hypothetical protein